MREKINDAKIVVRESWKAFKDISSEHGFFSTISVLFFVSLVSFIALITNSSEELPVSEKGLAIMSLPALTILITCFAAFVMFAPADGSTVGDSCFNKYGQDYINYSGTCTHKQEAARELASLFTEEYEPVKTGELKSKNGLTGFGDFSIVKRKAEDMGMIYCYHKNTGFASAQEYCKQSGGIE